MIYMTKVLINKMPSWRGRSLTALDLHLHKQMDEGQQHFLHFLGALCLIWRRVVEKQKQFLLTDNYQWQRQRWQQQQQQTTQRDVQCALSAPATTTIATTTSTNNNHNELRTTTRQRRRLTHMTWQTTRLHTWSQHSQAAAAAATLAFKCDYTLEFVVSYSGLYYR